MTPRFSLLTLFVLFFAVSCSNDDGDVPNPPPVNESPSISFVSPTAMSADGSALWNTVTVEINAQDSDGEVAKVEFLVEGTKEGELASAPYTFQWNTKNTEDGITELKAVVTDDEGETAETSITVNVLNVLLDYELYEGYLSTNENISNYTYITSPAPEREILFVSEITESTFANTVQRPADFDGEAFDVHFLEFEKGEQNKGEITTYHNITPGGFSPNPATPTDNGNELGEANVTFTNVPDHDYAMVFSGSDNNPIEENTERGFTVFENNNLGYVYLQVGNAGFYLATPFSVANHVLPLNEMNSSMQSHTFVDDGVNINASLLVRGHLAPGRFSPAVSVYRESAILDGEAFETDFHVPLDGDEVFDHYYFRARLIDENGKTYWHESYTDILSSMKKMDGTLASDNRKLSELDITASSNDNFDFILTRATVDASDTFSFVWKSYSGNDMVAFPPIPTEVFEKTNGVFNSSDIAFKDAIITLTIEDRDDYNGYPAYLDVVSGRQDLDLDGRTQRLNVRQTFN